ncbi:MAG: metallophosphoesterase [Geodermatophilaceae bacterium]
MRLSSRVALVAGVCAALLPTLIVVPAAAETRPLIPLTFALLGDTPYGDDQRAAFPTLVADVNADRQIRMVLHAGDVKDGSSTCDDARFADLAGLYNTFQDPFVLTPGDNEWTDCHRVTAGQYLPTERLEAVRDTFFPVPGSTLGQRRMSVTDQPGEQPRHEDYVENVRFERSGVVFATVHVVGSENDLEPWDELAGGDRRALRLAEFAQRRAANLDWIDAAFDRAESTNAVGVLLMIQAEPTDSQGFRVERERIVQRATAFGRPVLLVHGDEHVYEVEPQYAGVPTLTRLETFGATATEWLRVTVNPRSPEVFGWQPQSVPTG